MDGRRLWLVPVTSRAVPRLYRVVVYSKIPWPSLTMNVVVIRLSSVSVEVIDEAAGIFSLVHQSVRIDR